MWLKHVRNVILHSANIPKIYRFDTRIKSFSWNNYKDVCQGRKIFVNVVNTECNNAVWKNKTPIRTLCALRTIWFDCTVCRTSGRVYFIFFTLSMTMMTPIIRTYHQTTQNILVKVLTKFGMMFVCMWKCVCMWNRS